MNIGIIVYSQTGNTFSVAQKIQEKLAAAGHSVTLERVTIIGEPTPGAKNIQFETLPQVEPYDALILGAPVQGFSLTSVMTAYLQQLSSLQGKEVACFVTKQLPFHWTGGNKAVGQMKSICKAKGAALKGAEIVVWKESRRAESIKTCVEKLSSLF